MKKILLLLVLTGLISNIPSGQDISSKSMAQNIQQNTKINFTDNEIKTKLNQVISEPYELELNNINISINFHKLDSINEHYLKKRLFSLATFLLENNMAPDVVIAKWLDIANNYSYKAAVVKDDLILYKSGQMNYEDLFNKIKVVKSQIEDPDINIKQVLTTANDDKSVLKLSPSTNDLLVTDKPKLKPQKSMDNFYIPILKLLIHDDFTVDAQDNYVIVNIKASPLDEDQTRTKSFEIYKSIIGVNPSLSKIVICWQSEKGAFGKTASLAGVYIKDYFKRKLTSNELKEVILITTIEPECQQINKIDPLVKLDVPIDNLRKAKELRDAANIYRQNKLYESAIRTYKQAIKFNPNDYLSYYWLGEAYLAQNSTDKAKENFNKSLGLNPTFKKADDALTKLK